MVKKVIIVIGIVIGLLILSLGALIAMNNQKGVSQLKMPSDSGRYGSSKEMGLSSPSFSNPLEAMPPSRGGSDAVESDMYSEVSPEPASPTPTTPAEKKVIKSGNLALKVDRAEEAADKIAQIARDNQGEVFASNFYQGNGNNTKNGTITVKVPVANFEKTFSEIKKVASLVIRESTSGQDVTEQYVDLQAQLKNKQAEEAAFVRIMEQAQKIQDILDVQRELSRVRGQIEQLQGRLRFMEAQTDMSTITISLTEDAVISITDKWRPWQVVKESVSVLFKKFQNFIDFVIKLVILVIPVLLLYGLLLLLLYVIGKRIYARFKNKE